MLYVSKLMCTLTMFNKFAYNSLNEVIICCLIKNCLHNISLIT